MQILIVDDQGRTRQSLRKLLNTLPVSLEIQEAADGEQAVRLISELQPDLVVMDARMPVLDGVEATQRIKARWPEIKILILSMYQEYQEQAHRAGADAFVSKGAPPEELLDRICCLIHINRCSGGE